MGACAATSLMIGCSSDKVTPDAGPVADSGPVADTGPVADSGPTVDAGPRADTGPGMDVGTPDMGQMMSCTIEMPPDPTPDPACNGRWTTTLEGRLIDDNNDPIAAGLAQTCIRAQGGASLLCLRPETTCTDGTFANEIPMNGRCVEAMIMHSFVPGGDYADTYCELELPANGVQVTLADPVPVYRTTPPVNLPPEGDRSVARTVDFGRGLTMEVTPNGIFEGYDQLSAYELQPNHPSPCFIGNGDPDFTRVIGFAPNLDITGGDWPFRIANSGLNPGANVNFYVLGGLDCRLVDQGELVEEAHWEQYATGTVNADGSLDGNLPCLNWVAYDEQ